MLDNTILTDLHAIRVDLQNGGYGKVRRISETVLSTALTAASLTHVRNSIDAMLAHWRQGLYSKDETHRKDCEDCIRVFVASMRGKGWVADGDPADATPLDEPTAERAIDSEQHVIEDDTGSEAIAEIEARQNIIS